MEARVLLTHTNPNAILTVGVYDENVVDANEVDAVATGSSFTDAGFATRVATAFAEEQGGVIDGSVLGAYYAFGASHSKVLEMLPADGTNWGIGSGYHISTDGGFASVSEGGYDFTSLDFIEIDGGATGEAVVAFGLTALSITGRDYGNVTVTGRLASGGTVSATSHIFAATAQGDTFFGLEAPEGDSFTGFSIRYDGAVTGTPSTSLWFDDIGFITAAPAAVNRAPSASVDSYTVNEDTLLNIAGPGVLGNDSDPDGDPITAQLVSGPSHGIFRLSSDGSFLYLPEFNFSGNDTFTYVAGDGDLSSEVTTVTITVNAVNDAPFVDSPTVETDEDTPFSGQIDSIDIEGDSYQFALESDAANGTAIVNPDGSFTYTPDLDFHGTDTFTFRATDDLGASRTGSVTIVVARVNDAPTARDDAYSVNEDGVLTITGTPVFRLVMNSAPGETIGQGLSYSFTDATANFDADRNFDDGVSLDVDPPASGEFWSLDFAAPFGAELATGFYGGARRFPFQDPDEPGLDVSGNGRGHNMLVGEFTVHDVAYGPGGTVERFAASFLEQRLDFDGSTDPPLTGFILYNTAVGTGAGVLANDSDVDGDLFTAQLVTGPSHGTLSFNPDGTLSYTPDADFTGIDSFTYKINDGRLDSRLAAVTITVNGVNDVPVAADDAVTTTDAAPVTFDLLVNDHDIDGDTLAVGSVTQPAHGSVVTNADGTVTYTPAGDFAGTDTFTYTVIDGKGGSDTGTVTVRVLPRIFINDIVVTEGDSGTTLVTFNASLSNATTETVTVLGSTANGTATAGSDYSAIAGSVGTFSPGVTSLPFGVSIKGDTVGETNETFFVILSSPVNVTIADGRGVGTILDDDNQPPVATDDDFATDEDTPLIVDVLANDTDADGDSLTAAILSGPAHGTLTTNPDGTFTYTPNANYFGADRFTYSANDGSVDSNIATAFITIRPVNDPPIATPDTYRIGEEDVPLVVVTPGVLLNDTDVEGDALSAVLVSGPASGSLTLNPDGSFTYTPNPNFNGTDSFTYLADDGTSVSEPVTVIIAVNAVNDPPTLSVPGPQTIAEDVPLRISGIAVADLDVNEGTGEVRVTLSAVSGTLTVQTDIAGGLSAAQITGNGTDTLVLEGPVEAVNATLAAGLTYLGQTDFHGSDTLTVAVNDLGNTGAGGPRSATELVAIQVLSPEAQLDGLIEMVRQLHDDGALNRGQANALIVKLQNAKQKLLRGQITVTLNLLNAFSHQVLDFIEDGVLTSAQGDRLLDSVQDLRTSLETTDDSALVFANSGLWDDLLGSGRHKH